MNWEELKEESENLIKKDGFVAIEKDEWRWIVDKIESLALENVRLKDKAELLDKSICSNSCIDANTLKKLGELDGGKTMDKDHLERFEEVNQTIFAYAHRLREIGLEGHVVFLLHTIETLLEENKRLKEEIEDMNLQAKADSEKDY